MHTAPSLPSGYTYTPYYCEENIYLLADSFHRDSAITQAWEIDVVFVSNKTRTVALWNQKLSKDLDFPVVWDYHCILVLKPRPDWATARNEPAWVFDYDSVLTMPSRWSDYVQTTFKTDLIMMIPEQYRSNFRVVSAADFLDGFASDRSHMLKVQLSDGDPEYVAPPPNYPCIVGRKALNNGVSNNLMQTFVEMLIPGNQSDPQVVGKVMSDVEFWEWGQPGEDPEKILC